MARILVGLFEEASAAYRVLQEFSRENIPRERLNVLSNDVRGDAQSFSTRSSAGMGGGSGFASGDSGFASGSRHTIGGIGPIYSSGSWTGLDMKGGDLLGSLERVGVPHNDAELYAEGLRRGGTLIVGELEDAQASRALDIMRRHNVVDIHQRGNMWRQRGFSGFDRKARAFTAEQIDQERAFFRAGSFENGRVAVPVVEESIDVGKREMETGGVRVSSRVVETPVHEQVNLRQEHVTVERHRVDRPISPPADTAFREGVIEVREAGEQAVVAKQARVVEEVVIRKDVEQHAQQVEDTVRRTDVDVEQLSARTNLRGYDAYANDFRNNYNSNYASRGVGYERYEPAYRYGYGLASDKRYHGREWSDIELNVRRDWEGRNEGAWEQFKDAIRYSWDRARGKV